MELSAPKGKVNLFESYLTAGYAKNPTSKSTNRKRKAPNRDERKGKTLLPKNRPEQTPFNWTSSYVIETIEEKETTNVEDSTSKKLCSTAPQRQLVESVLSALFLFPSVLCSLILEYLFPHYYETCKIIPFNVMGLEYMFCSSNDLYLFMQSQRLYHISFTSLLQLEEEKNANKNHLDNIFEEVEQSFLTQRKSFCVPYMYKNNLYCLNEYYDGMGNKTALSNLYNTINDFSLKKKRK